MPDADLYPGRRALLRKLESIAELSADDAKGLLELPMRVEAHLAHCDLVREWDRASGCHLILDGFACRYKALPDGYRQILSFHTSGDIPDLQGMHLAAMDYGVSTLVPTIVGHIEHATLHDLTRRHPAIAQAFLRDTLVDAAIFREWMLSMGQRSAREHLAHLPCEMVLRLKAVGRPTDEMPLARANLAEALGLPAAQINRELQDLRRDGLVEPRASTLEVLDFEGLARLSGFNPAYLYQERVA